MSSARHPLLTPKWIVGHLLALTVLVSFSQAGFWQLRRHAQRMERNELLSARLAADPVPLNEALRQALGDWMDGDGSLSETMAERRVWAVGVFEPQDELLKRPVSREGHAGFHVVTPLAMEDGWRLLVERGWVPLAMDSVPLPEAAPPVGEVRVVGRLRYPDVPPSGWVAALAPRDPPDGRLGTVAYVDPERLQGQVAGPLVQAVLMLEETQVLEDSVAAQPPALGVQGAAAQTPDAIVWPLAPEPPRLGQGSHLGYALQWFAFTLVTLIGYPALLRRVLRTERGPAPSPPA